MATRRCRCRASPPSKTSSPSSTSWACGASLVGLSAGSAIALDSAVQAPDRVERLVLAAPSVGGYRPRNPPPFLEDLRSALRARDYPRAGEVLLASPLMAVPAEAQPLVRAMVIENNRLWTIPPELMQTPARPAIDRLEDVKAPTLVLLGDKDLDATKEQAELLLRRLSGAKLMVLPDGGHLLNLTSPEAFRQAVSAFLGS